MKHSDATSTSFSARATSRLQRKADEVIEDALGVFRAPSPPYRKAVSDVLWRGSKPEAADLAWMQEQGIRTVVDLRWNTENLAAEAGDAGLEYHNFGFVDGGVPSPSDLERALAVMSNPERQPVYVHCREGVGRTGIIVACYRIRHEKLDVELAVKDARDNGMRLGWQEKFIRDFAAREAGRAPTTSLNSKDTFEV